MLFLSFHRRLGLTDRQHKSFLAPLPLLLFLLSFLRHLCCTHAPILCPLLPGRRHLGRPGAPSVHQNAWQSLLPTAGGQTSAVAVPLGGAAAPLGTPVKEAPPRPGPPPRPTPSRPCRHPAAHSAALPCRVRRRRPLLPVPLQHPLRPPARCLFPAVKAVGGHQRQSAAPASVAPHHQPLPLTAAAWLPSLTLPKITARRSSENTTVAVRTIFFFYVYRARQSRTEQDLELGHK